MDLFEDLRLKHLELLHPDRMVDADFQSVVPDTQRAGAFGDLFTYDLVPDQPGLVAGQAFIETFVAENFFE